MIPWRLSHTVAAAVAARRQMNPTIEKAIMDF
jgi:hypothetical protein